MEIKFIAEKLNNKKYIEMIDEKNELPFRKIFSVWQSGIDFIYILIISSISMQLSHLI